MFDCYEPVPTLACPFCQAPLDGWQGKGGPCLLLTWRQGERAPVLDYDHPKEQSLPNGEISICTSCALCGQWADAECIVESGVWISTRFEQDVPPAIAADRIMQALANIIERSPLAQHPELIPALKILLAQYTNRKSQGLWPRKSHE